jgi:hypothetical protein
MKLIGIEIVVGARSEKLPTFMHLNYLVSFQNDAGEDCQRQHETLVREQALGDTTAIARIVAQVVHDLIREDPGPSALLRRPMTQALSQERAE